MGADRPGGSGRARAETDITVRRSRAQSAGSDRAERATAALRCPICNDDMVTMHQLNRHLDDTHNQQLGSQDQDRVQSWFSAAANGKPGQFPLSPIFNFLRESSEAVEALGSSLAGPSPPLAAAEPDEPISRAHFHRPTGHGRCHVRACRRPLTGAHPGENCRKCGRLFCSTHIGFEMRLSRRAMHDPENGRWFRVCQSCYSSRDGYKSTDGVLVDRTPDFVAVRHEHVAASLFETGRLESLMTILTRDLAALQTNPPSLLWPLTSGRAQRAVENSIAEWQDDDSVADCPICRTVFSLALRRHHCRLCGRVVCGDANNGCSRSIGLRVFSDRPAEEDDSAGRASAADESAVPGIADSKGGTNQPDGGVAISVRICHDCSRSLFRRTDFMADVAAVSPIQDLFGPLKDLERGVKALLPALHRHLERLQPVQETTPPPSASMLADMDRTSRLLSGAFDQYERAAKQIPTIDAYSPTSAALARAVHSQAVVFIQTNKPAIECLRKLVSKAQSAAHLAGLDSRNRLAAQPAGLPRLEPASLSADSQSVDFDAGSQSLSATASSIAQAEEVEQELRQQLIVLEEQHFFVSNMLSEAKQRREFDQVSTLAANLSDLDREINSVRTKLDKIDFSALYRSDMAGLSLSRP